ncbi:MAG: DUF2851 family protein [Thermoflexaceae bacterium]|nr:DUF2851 family protein [Thermoflexaceae bacterium]
MRPLPALTGEAALAARWGAGIRGPLRLEDGRLFHIIFPGIPAGGSGPDYRDAIIEIGGDLVRGDIELHLRAESWREHGHHLDAAYATVVLHVVAENRGGARTTLHASGRPIPVALLPPPAQGSFPPPYTPPCALAAARGQDPAATLERLGLRRLRIKAARVAPLPARRAPGRRSMRSCWRPSAARPTARPSPPWRAPCPSLPCPRASPPLRRNCAPARLTAVLKACAAGLELRRAGPPGSSPWRPPGSRRGPLRAPLARRGLRRLARSFQPRGAARAPAGRAGAGARDGD